jgi:hypothetical protein
LIKDLFLLYFVRLSFVFVCTRLSVSPSGGGFGRYAHPKVVEKVVLATERVTRVVEEVNMRGLSAEEQIIELRTALLRIHSRVLLLTTALDGLGETIAEEAGRGSSAAGTEGGGEPARRESSSFQENVLLYAQRRAARRTLTQAVRAGALIPQDALGFTVEGYPSSDEGIDVLARNPTTNRKQRIRT